MKAGKTTKFALLSVLIVLGMVFGTVPGISVLAQDLQPQVPPAPIPTFTDVPADHWAFSRIETMYYAGITAGCGTSPMIYCPNKVVTRAQMAVFLVNAMHGSGFVPPAPTGVFSDVPTDFWAAKYIEQLAADGITSGCAAGMYCPNNPVTRAQMAVFLLNALGVVGADLPAATGVFSDVPTDFWAAKYIEELARRGITSGCGAGIYCPANSVTRAQMAVFMVAAFKIVDPRAVVAQDFGVMDFSGVKGYSVGFGLEHAVAADAASVVVNLYNGTTLLATATTTGLLTNYPDATSLSAPFDVLGTFDYAADGNWGYSTWLGLTSVIPTKAEIIVTFKNGLVRTATNELLTGDTSIFTKGDVVPEDFSVFPGPVVIGYNVGFHLVDATYADVSNIEVKLYDGTTLLSTNTATAKFFNDFAAGTIQSSPFDVLGTFDYVSDGYWVNSGWSGFTSVIPTKAEITVTFKNGLVKVATNELLTGDTSLFTKGDVAAEDFGAASFSGVVGYTVGFHLVDATFADASDVVVKLYNNDTVLATATATAKVFADFAAATQLSAPFDVLGTFDYVTDGYWDYSTWSGFTSVIPTKAEITVTFKNGLVKTATNTNLTGDTSIFTKGNVVAQDFGVYENAAVNLKGYSVGFGLVDAVASDVDNVVINLYDGTTVLATATSTGILANYPTLSSLSAPFDVLGTFDYAADGNWDYTSWLGLPSTLPSKAEIIVTFKNGLVKTAANTNLTGDTSIFPEAPIEYFTDMNFSRTASPALLTSGTRSVSQVRHLDGSVTISVTSGDNEYIDSGIVMNIGTLGELDTITINGTGDFSFNLYLDTDKDGEFFLWNPDGTFAGVGVDDYALFEGPYVPPLFANGESLFGLTGHSPYTYTLDQLKALFPSDTPIGIWIGVTRGSEPAGTKRATITSVTVTTIP